MTKNYGLIEESAVFEKDWRAGGVSGATRTVLVPDGSYLDSLPTKEYQIGVYFDTMACVTFSALNCLETIMRVHGVDWNKSDRFTAKVSGTTRQGNYLRNVAEAIREYGLVEEEEWAYPREQRSPVYDWDNYYEDIPQELVMKGKRWLQDWDVEWEWIPPDRVREYLPFAPIQVGVYAWPKPDKQGRFSDGGNKMRNHAVELAKGTDEEYTIFDSYDNVMKKLVPDYDFKWALQYHLKRKQVSLMPTFDLPNDVLVQETERSGTFGLHLNGKIIVDDTAKLLATWLMRNKGDVKNKSVALKREDWESFPKVDLKNNPL